MKKFMAIFALLMTCLFMAGCEEYTAGFDDDLNDDQTDVNPDGNGGDDGNGDVTNPDLIVTPTTLEEFLIWMEQDEANVSSTVYIFNGMSKSEVDFDGVNTKSVNYEVQEDGTYLLIDTTYTDAQYEYIQNEDGTWSKTELQPEEEGEEGPISGLTAEDFTLEDGTYYYDCGDGSFISITFNEDGSIDLNLFAMMEDVTGDITGTPGDLFQLSFMNTTFYNFGNVTVTLPTVG